MTLTLVNYRKQIKIHFIDPLFYDVVSTWTGVKKPEDPVEGVVASHLSRFYTVGYTEVGNEEIGVVTLPDMTGYEVKYREKAKAGCWEDEESNNSLKGLGQRYCSGSLFLSWTSIKIF